jgi:hypothetical protein
VRELVGNDVVDQFNRQVDQTPIQPHVATCAATAPSGSSRA